MAGNGAWGERIRGGRGGRESTTPASSMPCRPGTDLASPGTLDRLRIRAGTTVPIRRWTAGEGGSTRGAPAPPLRGAEARRGDRLPTVPGRAEPDGLRGENAVSPELPLDPAPGAMTSTGQELTG